MKIKMTVEIPAKSVREIRKEMKFLGIPQKAFVPMMRKWIQETDYASPLTDIYTAPDRKTAYRIAMRQAGRRGQPTRALFMENGEERYEEFIPKRIQKLIEAGKKMRYVFSWDRREGPWGWEEETPTKAA